MDSIAEDKTISKIIENNVPITDSTSELVDERQNAIEVVNNTIDAPVNCNDKNILKVEDTTINEPLTLSIDETIIVSEEKVVTDEKNKIVAMEVDKIDEKHKIVAMDVDISNEIIVIPDNEIELSETKECPPTSNINEEKMVISKEEVQEIINVDAEIVLPETTIETMDNTKKESSDLNTDKNMVTTDIDTNSEITNKPGEPKLLSTIIKQIINATNRSASTSGTNGNTTQERLSIAFPFSDKQITPEDKLKLISIINENPLISNNPDPDTEFIISHVQSLPMDVASNYEELNDKPEPSDTENSTSSDTVIIISDDEDDIEVEQKEVVRNVKVNICVNESTNEQNYEQSNEEDMNYGIVQNNTINCDSSTAEAENDNNSVILYKKLTVIDSIDLCNTSDEDEDEENEDSLKKCKFVTEEEEEGDEDTEEEEEGDEDTEGEDEETDEDEESEEDDDAEEDQKADDKKLEEEKKQEVYLVNRRPGPKSKTKSFLVNPSRPSPYTDNSNVSKVRDYIKQLEENRSTSSGENISPNNENNTTDEKMEDADKAYKN